VPATAAQTAHIQEASRNPALSAKANGGHPAIAATARPGSFTGPGVVGARGAVAPPAKAPTAGQPNTAHGAPNTEAPKKGAPPAASAQAPAAKAQKPHPKGDSDRDKKHEAEDAGKQR